MRASVFIVFLILVASCHAWPRNKRQAGDDETTSGDQSSPTPAPAKSSGGGKAGGKASTPQPDGGDQPSPPPAPQEPDGGDAPSSTEAPSNDQSSSMSPLDMIMSGIKSIAAMIGIQL